MLDMIRETMSVLQLEAAGYSGPVQVWMQVMSIAFFSAVVFAPWKRGARWILAAIIINVAGLIILKTLYPELSRTAIGTSVHLAFWPVALWAIWRASARSARRDAPASLLNSVYTVWLIAVSAVMATSIILDARTLIGWLI